MPRQLSLIHVAIGVIVNQDQKILIAERPVDKTKAGFWEFPGGKVEQGETAFEALKRELQEEVGILISTAVPFLKVNYQEIVLDAWIVKEFTGNPSGLEGQVVKWVEVAQFDDYIFPEGNKEIIQKLKMNCSIF